MTGRLRGSCLVLGVLLLVVSALGLAEHYGAWPGSRQVEFAEQASRGEPELSPSRESDRDAAQFYPDPFVPSSSQSGGLDTDLINTIDETEEISSVNLGQVVQLDVSTAGVSLSVYRHTQQHNQYIHESADEISEVIEPLAGQVGWIQDTRTPPRTAEWLTDSGVSILIGHVTSDVFEPLTTSEEFRRVGSEFVVIHEHGRSVWRVVDESRLDKQDDFVDYAVEQSRDGVPNLWLVTCVPGGERTPNPNWGVSRDIYLWRAELVSTEVSD